MLWRDGTSCSLWGPIINIFSFRDGSDPVDKYHANQWSQNLISRSRFDNRQSSLMKSFLNWSRQESLQMLAWLFCWWSLFAWAPLVIVTLVFCWRRLKRPWAILKNQWNFRPRGAENQAGGRIKVPWAPELVSCLANTLKHRSACMLCVVGSWAS